MAPTSFLPLISVLLIATVRIVEIRTRRDTVPGEIRERTSLRFLMLAGHATLVASLLEWYLAGGPLILLPFLIGWMCAIASFALRWWTIRTLGRMWSLHVEIRARHELILTGPFRYVRHPTYLSVILEFLALALICSAWHVLVVVPILLIAAISYRIRLEEAALLHALPGYADYRRRVPAIFPWKGRVL